VQNVYLRKNLLLLAAAFPFKGSWGWLEVAEAKSSQQQRKWRETRKEFFISMKPRV
jgi:hypothetical protein